MTKYDFFDQGFARLGMEFGLINPSRFNDFIMYKVFLELKEQGLSQAESIRQMEDRFNCSQSTCWRAIRAFNEEFQFSE